MNEITMGEIHNKDTLFLRIDCGHATDPERGTKYELSTLSGGSPCVRNEKNGKWFTLSWHDILNMAQFAGIDEE